ncbi:glycoside hydrolase family 28 protein [Flammeovirgaceae bacterium SG7u.111]|nr:glycoside hydrolase family 28 protein [Flammeovirgaceae bacterium SG7u.132]WPO36600.1 glycoside hydrolase family 28 protein [Flammeovirgaceae bacterium SG7u.111]
MKYPENMKQLWIAFALLSLILACNRTSTTGKVEKVVVIKEDTPWGEEVFTIPTFKEDIFTITDYDAKERAENNQVFIQAAIDACHANGGGVVLVPAGTWATSYLDMKSNVNLHLVEGAALSFLDDIELYNTPTFTRWEGIECMNFHPLIYARDAENMAVTGKGKIIGNGKKWWAHAKGTQKGSLAKLYDQVEANVAPEERNCLAFSPTSYLRPSLIQFINCKNVLLDSVEIGSGPMWTVHLVYCENVVAQNLKVITNGVNNDGIVPDASKKVLINNCFFSTGDDCIVIKSGLNEDGWRVGKASERIVIKDCKTEHGHGGVVIGSEMSGGVRNIYAYNCDFSQTQRGLRVKSMKGRGGVVENLWFKDIRMDNIEDEAIRINLDYGASSITPRTDSLPIFRNFHFENIKSVNSNYCVRITGSPEINIEGLTFVNLEMQGKYGIHMNNVENTTFTSAKIEVEKDMPLVIKDSQRISFDSTTFTANSTTMVKLVGKKNEDITFKNSNASTFEVPFEEEEKSNISIQ